MQGWIRRRDALGKEVACVGFWGKGEVSDTGHKFGEGVRFFRDVRNAVSHEVRVVCRNVNTHLIEIRQFNLAPEKDRQDHIHPDSDGKRHRHFRYIDTGGFANRVYKVLNLFLGPSQLGEIHLESTEKFAFLDSLDDFLRHIDVKAQELNILQNGASGKVPNGLRQIGTVVLPREEVIEYRGREEAVIVEADDDIQYVFSINLFGDDSEEKFPLICGKEVHHRARHRVHAVPFIVVASELFQDSYESV